jgi:hypothetical protein
VDFLYTRLVNSVQLADENLAGIQGVSEGEGGRPLYGTIDASGGATPTRVKDDLQGVFVLHNGSPDRSYSITAQLAKVFRSGVEVSVAYTYTDAKDRMSMDGDLTSGNLGSTPVDGTLAERALRTSFWARPHKVTALATTDLPFGFRFGITYVGMSGEPYTYVAVGDPNADGFPLDGSSTSNDAIYVPKDRHDITLEDSTRWTMLDQLIRSEPCLRNQRGRVMTRNSCRDPWINETSAQLSKRFRLADRRAVAITANVFNLLNLLHSEWGLMRVSGFDPAGNVFPLLEMRGYDIARGRGIYDVDDVSLRQIDPDASRWRLQLSATFFY